jgi:hypothetical protein
MIRKGILKAWASPLSSVQIIGSLSVYLDSIPTSRAIPTAEMVVGRNVAVLFLDPSNFLDAVVIAVWT